MDKFIINRVRPLNPTFQTVRIHAEAYNLFKQMQADTGMSFVDLVDACAVFCAERLVVKEPKE